jgi:hypothetical protein
MTIIAGSASSAQSSTAQTGIYTPPQYAAGPAMVSITVLSGGTPVAPASTQANTMYPALATANASASPVTATMYVFQAVLSVEHAQRLEKTHHPVQTSADVSSHAYLMPAQCVMDIGMSDAMAAYTSASVTKFSGSSTSASVNAYQTMLALQASRSLLTITTRLRTYSNMVVGSISPREDSHTITGLRMRIEFEQILMASASTVPVTTRSDVTTTTGLGTVNSSSVGSTTQSQFKVPATSIPSSATSTGGAFAVHCPINVPGAGAYSSVPGQGVTPAPSVAP